MNDNSQKDEILVKPESAFKNLLDDTATIFNKIAKTYKTEIEIDEIGSVNSTDQGIAIVDGLPSIQADELLRFQSGVYGMAYNLDAYQVGVILLGKQENLKAGQKVYRTGRVMDVPRIASKLILL